MIDLSCIFQCREDFSPEKKIADILLPYASSTVFLALGMTQADSFPAGLVMSCRIVYQDHYSSEIVSESSLLMFW